MIFKTKLKLEVNHTYLSRSGRKVLIRSVEDCRGKELFRGEIDGYERHFNEDGSHCYECKEFQLLKEVV